MIRKPAVAGQFYPQDKKKLNLMIASFEDKAARRSDCIGVILPHAGYAYSGRVAVEAISRVNLKENVILLGPNHTGQGALYSIMTEGAWLTPLGEARINQELAEEIYRESGCLQEDSLAHLAEHSLEVEIPILQYFKNDIRIVPIAIMGDEPGSLDRIALAIAGVINKKNLMSRTTIIASSDMTHYESRASAEKKDHLAIEAIRQLDEKELNRLVKQYRISMCGILPVTVLIKAAKILGAKKGQLIKYQTSGDTTGDDQNVVGYAGITIN